MTSTDRLASIVASVRPALKSVDTNAADRAHFLYDLVREVYDHVKFDIHGAAADTAERTRLGDVLNAALPPTSHDLKRETGGDL